MNQYILLLTFLIATIQTEAQAIAATQLNAMEEKASLIKQFESIVMDVESEDRVTVKTHQRYVVMNENGQRALYFQEYIDPTESVDNIEINVFDATGSSVAKYRKKDIQSYAVGDGLIDDNFLLFFRVPVTRYPVIVEYKFENKSKGTLFYPAFNIASPGEKVENSTFVAKVPKDLDLRFKAQNTDIKPVITEEGQKKIYTWRVSNMPSFEHEEGSLNDPSKFPRVVLAPNKFRHYNYSGDLSSWKEFGRFVYDLNKGRDQLPEDKVQMFRALVSDAADDREKVRRIYEYLQQNFRYVSIQLGIGGFQSFTADFTDKKKYGDCKSLSNYMKAALKAVNINSHLAVINAGANRSSMDPEFPVQMMNHMILCVPNNKDTLWLECTSKTSEFAVLGAFTENRRALLVTEDGGVLVNTPTSRSFNNAADRTTWIRLESDGAGELTQSIRTSGSFREIMEAVKNEKGDDIKAYVVLNWKLKQPDEFTITFPDKPAVHVTSLHATYEKVPEFMVGSKMFLAPRLYAFWSKKLPDAKNRKMDYYFSEPMLLIDTTNYILPEGYTIDALPSAKELDCDFARYKTRYVFNADTKTVSTIARLEIIEHHIPAAKYAEVKEFFDKILLEDGQRVVIKKN